MQKNQGNLAYDLSKFESKEVRRRQDLIDRKKAKDAERKTKLEIKQQLKQEAKASSRQSVKIMFITCSMVALLGFMIYARAQVFTLGQKVDSLNDDIAISESEYTRLEMELEARVSTEKVEAYASKELGMEKLNKSQIEYIDLSEESKIVLSSPPEKQSFFEKITAQIEALKEQLS